MNYTDRVYGRFVISEPVILDLIKCPSLQRLKGIDQVGNSAFFSGKENYSRFEHSLGVYLLLKIYGAPLREQIAGLIHDVSHTAFSHCVDYALCLGSGKKQDHQDRIFNRFVRRSEIPTILKKRGFDLEYVLDENNFPLEERPLPDLCADRLDYSLRSAVVSEEISPLAARAILADLAVEKNRWVFLNFRSARKYARLFQKINSKHYCNLRSAAAFQSTGDYLRRGLEKKYIGMKDLELTDREVLRKISPFHRRDRELKLLFERMSDRIPYRNDPRNYQAVVWGKSRIVDPLFKENGRIIRLSTREPKWGIIVRQELKPKKFFLKFEK
jgi:hypothetical protein